LKEKKRKEKEKEKEKVDKNQKNSNLLESHFFAFVCCLFVCF
jgi:hypothetical protein